MHGYGMRKRARCKSCNKSCANKMICHCVLWNCSPVGVSACAADADLVAKGLHDSTVVQCRMNDYTRAKASLLLHPTPTGAPHRIQAVLRRIPEQVGVALLARVTIWTA